MHFLSFSVFALQAASTALGNPVPQDDAGAIAAAEGVEELASLAQSAFAKSEELLNSGDLQKRGSTCTLRSIKVRKEWGSLTKQERLDYIKAVQCFTSKPARTPSEIVPGAKTRFDDFVTTHVNQTFSIHLTGNFLSWHRHYTWLYEEALREECGYTGTQPYWDWTKTAITGLETSPIFDGSETSMSGDGEHVPNQGPLIIADIDGKEIVRLPTGNGGGCVKSGPFKNFTVNLGPVMLTLPGGGTGANPEGPFAHNPRCLKRDLTTAINRRYSNASAVIHNILVPQDIDAFQNEMQGDPTSPELKIGIHAGGHYSFGADPARDFFTSPGDPVFYLHHGMVDRLWWIWQMLSPHERQFTDRAVAGTNTFLNMPPSPNTTLDDFLDYGYAGQGIKIRDAMSILSGPYCYVYL
ncbi:tyrosinase central domain protein [Colletotrichum plurivorum]|uniref:Tyrosinase central domain protein n=1 Tax=Colletotrichum plurivorum TaxID=2175906 RepID=A0A8H6KBA5_9PEZI|nr:tyrosinase central domain protein [Colletotrichum plurivorum]